MFLVFELLVWFCKVALATLHEFKMADTLQWTRLHPDYLCRIAVSWHNAYLELCIGGYVHAGRPVGLPESAVTSSEVQNGIYIKALVGVSSDSFVVSKYITI